MKPKKDEGLAGFASQSVSTGSSTRSESRGLWHLVAAIAAFGLAIGMGGPARANQIVVNGNFAAGGASLVSPIPGWNTSALLPGIDGGIWGVECAPPLPCDFFDADTAPPTDTLSQVLNTQPGHVYEISFGLDTDSTGPGEFSADFGSTTLVDLVNPGPTNGFEELKFFVEATAPTTVLSFNFNSFLQTEINNVSVPEPGSMALLAISLAGVWATRRRNAQ